MLKYRKPSTNIISEIYETNPLLNKLLAGLKIGTVCDKYVADDGLYPGADHLLSIFVKVNFNFSSCPKWLVTVEKKNIA